MLRDRCGLGPGTPVLEIGPGPGIATRHLLSAGARVVAVEPDPALATHLTSTAGPGATLDVRVSAFEDAALPDGAFDLAVAATSFHWVDPAVGLTEVRRVLRPGGWWAMWWNVFGDPERDDPFHDATADVLAPLVCGPAGPTTGAVGGAYALEREDRTAELTAAGFEAVAVEWMPWTLVLTSRETRALYATYSPISRLEPAERERVLDGVEAIAAREFRDRVERNVITALYSARTKLRP